MMTPDRENLSGSPVPGRYFPLKKLLFIVTSPRVTALLCFLRQVARGSEARGRMALQKYLLIAAGGGLGSIARYWIGSSIASRTGIRFPYGTLVVNITACLILGFTLTYMGKRADIDPAWRYFLPLGFIGAYSTFSTYEWETLSTMRSGAFALAALYAAASLVLGLAAVWCGTVLGEAL
jgi:CrcB protein